jgi:Sec-independent protein translocase protein TatA
MKMTGFMGWFLTIVLVLAIFNAEKLPALRRLLEEKFKTSLDAAKEGSKIAKDKLKQVKTDIENKKNAPASEHDPDENTPEEIEESLKFMGDFIKQNNKPEDKVSATPEQTEEKMPEEKPDEDTPIDLEHRY